MGRNQKKNRGRKMETNVAHPLHALIIPFPFLYRKEMSFTFAAYLSVVSFWIYIYIRNTNHYIIIGEGAREGIVLYILLSVITRYK